jgi:Chaperone of endosialidase/Secretion system C-terminal sorting domain
MKTKKQVVMLLTSIIGLTGSVQSQWVIAGGNTFHNQAASNKVVIGYPPPYPNPPTAGQLVVSTTNTTHRFGVDVVNFPVPPPTFGFVYGVSATSRISGSPTSSAIPVGSYGRATMDNGGLSIGLQGDAFNNNTTSGSAIGVWGFGSIQNCAAATGTTNTAIGLYGQANTPAACTNKGWAVYADGRTFTPAGVWTASDEKLKTNIREINNAIDMVNRLQPRMYEFKQDARYANTSLPQGLQVGFMAQDLEKVLPEAVTDAPLFIHKTSGDLEKKGEMESENIRAVNYNMLIPVLTQAIKEQQQQINELERKLAKLEGKNTSVSAKGMLMQNQPNPFNRETSISVQLAKNTRNAKLVIYDMDGKMIKQLPLAATAVSTTTIKAGELNPGTYIYTLLCDGVETDSKKMVITR